MSADIDLQEHDKDLGGTAHVPFNERIFAALKTY
jgi:hypothetical protein